MNKVVSTLIRFITMMGLGFVAITMGLLPAPAQSAGPPGLITTEGRYLVHNSVYFGVRRMNYYLLSSAANAQSDCSVIYEPGNGWAVEKCATDPNITPPKEELWQTRWQAGDWVWHGERSMVVG